MQVDNKEKFIVFTRTSLYYRQGTSLQSCGSIPSNVISGETNTRCWKICSSHKWKTEKAEPSWWKHWLHLYARTQAYSLAIIEGRLPSPSVVLLLIPCHKKHTTWVNKLPWKFLFYCKKITTGLFCCSVAMKDFKLGDELHLQNFAYYILSPTSK